MQQSLEFKWCLKLRSYFRFKSCILFSGIFKRFLMHIAQNVRDRFDISKNIFMRRKSTFLHKIEAFSHSWAHIVSLRAPNREFFAVMWKYELNRVNGVSQFYSKISSNKPRANVRLSTHENTFWYMESILVFETISHSLFECNRSSEYTEIRIRLKTNG